MFRTSVLSAVATLALSGVAMAGNIDFSFADDGVTALSNGQSLVSTSPFGTLFNLTSYGNNQGAAIFDTTSGVNGADPDLWVDFGNALIFQSNDSPSRAGGVFSTPNDSARGGRVFFDFLVEGLTIESLDVIDVDSGGMMKIWLWDGDGNERTVVVPDHFTGDVDRGAVGWATINLLSGLAQESSEIAGLFTTVFTEAGFDAHNIAMMKVRMWGSGAIDNLRYSTIIPLPPAIAMGLAGVSGLVVLRRRRKTA